MKTIQDSRQVQGTPVCVVPFVCVLVYFYQQQKIRELEVKIKGLKAQNRMTQEVAQALGDLNRFYASEAIGHSANDNEAFLHYVEKGGKTAFDSTHPN